MFKEHSDLSNEISKFFVESLLFAAGRWELHYNEAVPDIARRLMYFVMEFEPEEIRRSSLKPWEMTEKQRR